MNAKIENLSFVLKPDEQADIAGTMVEKPINMVRGVVKDEKGQLIKYAIVKLFKTKDCTDDCDLEAVAHTLTDAYGRFFFRYLIPEERYVVEVYVNDSEINKMNNEHVPNKSLNETKSVRYEKSKSYERRRIPGW